jgi:hypothetical protein
VDIFLPESNVRVDVRPTERVELSSHADDDCVERTESAADRGGFFSGSASALALSLLEELEEKKDDMCLDKCGLYRVELKGGEWRVRGGRGEGEKLSSVGLPRYVAIGWKSEVKWVSLLNLRTFLLP